MEGISDLLIFLPRGRTLHIETKSTTGRLSEAQALWKQELEPLDHPYHVVRSVKELESLLNQHGVDTSVLGRLY